MTQETNIYLHIPFCRRRCGYCDFNTFAGFSHAIPVYVKALCREVEFLAEREVNKKKIKTIFFGGGTPSLLSVSQFSEIMGSLRKSFEIDPQAEITLEANPGTVSREYLAALRDLGFTRISFGMQSAHPHDLIMLDRQHTFEDVANAVAWSRLAGFDHVNLDLIFGIPGQSLESWQRTLKLAAGFDVDHLSLYSLTIEERTPMAGWLAKGLIEAVEDDLSADMYQSAGEILQSGGFIQYEISNWAKMRPDGIQSQCRHNLNTWRYQPYYGFGAGAHGFIGDIRTANVEPIPAYLDRMNSPQGDWPAAESVERLTRWDKMQEFMMVGLRLTLEGISQSEFYERFGIPCLKVFGRQVEMCMQHGLLEFGGAGNDIIRLTPHGRLLGNQVFMEFVGNALPDGCQLDQ